MRTYLRHLAVVVPLVLVTLLLAAPAQGQFKLNTFDSAVADSQFSKVYNGSANLTEPNAIQDISDDSSVKSEGAASLKSVWRVHTTEDYGGFNMLSHTLPTKTDSGYFAKKYRALHGDSTFMNWDAGTHLSIWYNNLSPSTASGNAVQMRFHIYEAGPNYNYYNGDNTDYEDWYFQSPVPVNDATPGWHELIIPLVDTGTRNSPGANGFCITDWSAKHPGNEKLDLNKIIGYTIEWTSSKVTNDTASGIVFYDDLRLGGLGYKPGDEALYFFNNFTKDTTDFNSGWNNGGQSAFNLFEEKTDTLMGSSVLGVDWKINVKESWGGGANREYNIPGGAFFPDLGSKTELQLFCKVVEPITSSTGTIGNTITMRLALFDYSDGNKEAWYTVVPVRMDSVGAHMGWQQIILPLKIVQSGSWNDLKVGQFNTPNPPDTKDMIFAPGKIGGFKFEFSSSRGDAEPYAPDLVYSGKLLFSAVIPSGFQETDHTPPTAVGGVNVTPQSFANLLQWADVPGEVGATYTGWVSEKPFTSTDEPGVEDLPPTGLPAGTQLANHILRSPITDQSVSLYYGVTATDKAGNTNAPAVVGPITNTAKGVPTIAKVGPASFTADGDLSEWSGITPILLSVNPATPTAHAAGNSTISGDPDLKVNAYLAMDATYLYVAFDADDDVVSADSTGSDWLWDSPDLFLGLYDWRGKHHGGYLHGTTPDYHLRFSINQIKIDNGGVVLMKPGPEYAWVEKQLTSGYVVEARIPWALFHEKVPNDSLFSPVEGMRIPIDFEINDNDTKGTNNAREGMMAYSTLNNDDSYSFVSHWTYTWIGAKSSTLGVSDQPTIANVYELQQNYPNPFNPSTIINYSLAKSGPVTLKVFDVLGREVATLVNGEVQAAGSHQVAFSASSLARGISSGVYFYRIESGSFRDVKKMMLVK